MKIGRTIAYCVAIFFVADCLAEAFDFSNITNWVGAGPNQAAFVVAWYDSKTPDPMVWGYRWSGTAPTVLTMMQTVAAADSRFSFTPHPLYSSGTSYAVYSVFYDLTGLGGSPTVGLPGNLGGSENGYPPYPGDHYREGWYIKGFWGELTATGNPYNGGAWKAATVGVAVQTLTNNSWYALSYSTDETHFTIPSPPSPALPVPSVPGCSGYAILFVVTLLVVRGHLHPARRPRALAPRAATPSAL